MSGAGLPTDWDLEADVAVLGMGAAGYAAAIEAHDAGAEPLVLEKLPPEFAGATPACPVGHGSTTSPRSAPRST